MAIKRKSTKKESTKTVIKKDSPAKVTHETNVSPKESTTKAKFFSTKRNRVFTIFVVVVLILAAVAYKKPDLLVAALVNGKPVTQIELINELEKQYGKQTLDNLVTQKLILQEASKQKITVTDKEINDEISKISDSLKSQNMTLDTALSLNGQTMQQLKDNIKINLIAQKMFASKITVSDQEIQDYFNQNKSSFPANTKIETVRDQIKQTLTQNKLSTEFSTWISDLKAKSSIKYFIQ